MNYSPNISLNWACVIWENTKKNIGTIVVYNYIMKKKKLPKKRKVL